MTRTKDPDVLRQAHEVWSKYGCAVCGDRNIEVHHLRKRSQGGADTPGNLIGLCGAFSKNKHHEAAESGDLQIYWNQDHVLVWNFRRTAEYGICRMPSDAWFSESGLNGVAPVEYPPTAVLPEGAAHTAPTGTVSAPARASVPVPPSSPAERFAALQEMGKGASVLYMAIARNLLEVEESGEWQTLSYESFRDYWGEEGLGLPQGTVSKMLRVARTYRDRWDDAIRTGASVEKLWIAARAASDVDEAISLAANAPSYQLVAMTKGEPVDVERCPTCGQPVKASTQRGDPKKEDDARSES